MARKFALIPAAGSGSRMGADVPKQYLQLLGKPLLHHTLSIFCMHPLIDRVYVVLSPDDTLWQAELAVEALYCGGPTRAASVLNGLRAMPAEEEDWVLVHDAARPCLSPMLLDRLITALQDDAVGGLLAVPVADTLKRADAQGRVAGTEPRVGLWRAQTPQMFRYGLLRNALEAMGSVVPTDEAQAVEALGYLPKLVPGDNFNLKVTYPEDLRMAQWILQEERT
jgi:2-C-methyl-D-erythritol 4-phosphate cytidylyltransferase